jgi:hypothetical protein
MSVDAGEPSDADLDALMDAECRFGLVKFAVEEAFRAEVATWAPGATAGDVLEEVGELAEAITLRLVRDGFVVRRLCTCPQAPNIEGPQEDCEVHGQDRAILVREREEARAELAALRRSRELPALWTRLRGPH